MSTPFQTETHILCPLCGREFAKPVTEPEGNLSAVDVALGLAPGVMRLQHAHNQARNLERDLSLHFTREHKIEEWLEAVVARERELRMLRPAAQETTEASSVVCSLCRRTRTPSDHDYSPTQVIAGTPVGWYSGEDGEVCPQCMTQTLEMQR